MAISRMHACRLPPSPSLPSDWPFERAQSPPDQSPLHQTRARAMPADEPPRWFGRNSTGATMILPSHLPAYRAAQAGAQAASLAASQGAVTGGANQPASRPAHRPASAQRPITPHAAPDAAAHKPSSSFGSRLTDLLGWG